MTRLPKPLFKWEDGADGTLFQPVYVLQAYNYRISIERAKLIYEVTGITFANRIIGWFTGEYLNAHPDAPVVASTVVELYSSPTDPDVDKQAVDQYIAAFGYGEDFLAQVSDHIPGIVADLHASVSGRRAKYELAYTIHIMRCQCMNYYSDTQHKKEQEAKTEG